MDMEKVLSGENDEGKKRRESESGSEGCDGESEETEMKQMGRSETRGKLGVVWHFKVSEITVYCALFVEAATRWRQSLNKGVLTFVFEHLIIILIIIQRPTTRIGRTATGFYRIFRLKHSIC